MADDSSSCNSSETEDKFELSVSISLSSEASKEMLLWSLTIRNESLICFEPDLPATTDCDMEGRACCTAVSECLIVDRVGSTNW